MALRSLRDVALAHREGRTHQQRFVKTINTTTGDGSWLDWSYAGGQPAYDARVGIAGEFNPIVATKNDAIYFPPIAAGLERQLTCVTIRTKASNSGQTGLTFEVYDLLGIYPLIDGDSTDEQAFDNTLPLPRYTSGDGVRAVIVNHVAPMIAAVDATVAYIDSDGNSQSVVWSIALTGQNRVAYTTGSAGTAGGPLFCNMASGSKGIKSITSLTFSAPPGGLFCIYLVRPLMTVTHYHDPLSSVATGGGKIAVQKCALLHNGYHAPVIYDGASLGFFYMPTDGSRTNDFFGHFDFTWG